MPLFSASADGEAASLAGVPTAGEGACDVGLDLRDGGGGGGAADFVAVSGGLD